MRGWLTPKPAPDFESKCTDVCAVYNDATAAAHEDVRIASIDEMTGVQALERAAPNLPMQPGKVDRQEFEYIRHGTQTMIAAFDVASGQVTARIGETRTELDYARFLEDLFATGGATTKWRVIADNLNTHVSESVARLVARLRDVDEDLGENGKSGVLASMATREASCATGTIAFAFTLPPSTPPRSTRSRYGSPSWLENSYDAPASFPRRP